MSEVTELYDYIFNESYLIRYGYYDIKDMKKIADYSSKSELEENEILYGKSDAFYLRIFNMNELDKLIDQINDCYFNYNFIYKGNEKNLETEEINSNGEKTNLNPKIFYETCVNLDEEYSKDKTFIENFELDNFNDNKLYTEPIYFNIPKTKYTRRQYKMPNLYSYISLVYFLVDYKERFKEIFLENNFSTSKYFNEFGFNYSYTKKMEQQLLYGGKNILNLDLSNFYHTLYTHSIPWVIMGKQESKRNRTEGFANELDRLIQNCQYGETHGIPVGNLASRIIAEFYMCHIDKMLVDKFKYARYVDDIKFSYTSEKFREDFLMEYNRLCREFNLIINDSKTIIESFPYQNKNQKDELFNYLENIATMKSDQRIINKINDFIDYCIHEEGTGNKGSLKSLFVVLKNTVKQLKLTPSKLRSIFLINQKGTNFILFERLLDISLKDSRLTNNFLSLSEQLLKDKESKTKAKDIVQNYFLNNSKLYKDKLNSYLDNGFNQEVYQLILYNVIFYKKSNNNFVNKKLLKKILELEYDDYTSCLCIILWYKRVYSRNKLLDILENKLKETHFSYLEDGIENKQAFQDEKSIRMQEKYWFLRYFIFYLIELEIIKKEDSDKHFRKFPRTKTTNIVQSELNSKYILQHLHNGYKKSQKNNINGFYRLLLNNKVSLVSIGEAKKYFNYL